MNWHLMRVDYRTDASTDDPEYRGSFSAPIPDRALQGGEQIVAVDWSERGWVQVTFLVRGDGPFDRPARERPPARMGATVAEQLVEIEGHTIDYRAHRYECTRCGARLLSIMQFQSRECPGPREVAPTEAPDSTPTEREARVRFPKSVGNATVDMEAIQPTEREAGDVGEVALIEDLSRERDALAEKVRAVGMLHSRRPWRGGDFVHFGQSEFPDLCNHCHTRWPCRTIAAMAPETPGVGL